MDVKKIKLNLFFGFLSQGITIALGLIVPRLLLTSYGSEVNGLLSSVTNIYAYIALLEAGVGTATMQALYHSIAVKDRDGTNGIIAATHFYYRRTGILYLFSVIVFATGYPFLIGTEISKIQVFLIILFNGLGNVVAYFFQGKYVLLIQAEGKSYVTTATQMITNIFKYGLKIVLILMGYDVVWVQFSAMLVTVVQMLMIMAYVRKEYVWINLKVTPNYESISQSKNVLIHQISGLVFSQTDVIVLTIFCGLKIVSVYSMYTLIFSSISMILATLSSSVTFKLAHIYHQDRVEYLKFHDLFEIYYMAAVFALYSIANFFILPFMTIYTHGVTDVNYIDPYLSYLLITTYLMSSGRHSAGLSITFEGHFKLTQSRTIIESCINLVTSLVAVQYFGIYGVIIGTIAALLYRSNDVILYANHRILHRSVWPTYRRWLTDVTLFVAIAVGSRYITIPVDTYARIFLWCIPYSVAVFAVYLLVNCLIERDSTKYISAILKEKIRGFTDNK